MYFNHVPSSRPKKHNIQRRPTLPQIWIFEIRGATFLYNLKSPISRSRGSGFLKDTVGIRCCSITCILVHQFIPNWIFQSLKIREWNRGENDVRILEPKMRIKLTILAFIFTESLHKILRSPDAKALKLWKGQSGKKFCDLWWFQRW